MSALRPPGTRIYAYARFSTTGPRPEIVDAPRRDTVQFDIAQGTIVQPIYSDYIGQLSRCAIEQAVQDADRGARS